MKTLIRTISIALSIVVLMVSICSCNKSNILPLSVAAGELYTPSGKVPDKQFFNSVISFSSDLLKESIVKNKNVFISPYSLISALSVVYNGSDGETKAQFEKLMGMDVDKLNEYMYSYNKNLLSYNTNYTQLSIANSIWVNEPYINVNEDFLQKAMSYYSSDIYREDLYQDGIVDEINDWCYKKTGKMIDKIIEQVDPNVVMFIMNAIYFDSQWDEKYESKQIIDNEFKNYNGTKSKIKFLSSTETKGYKGKDFIGVKKYYKDKNFSFVAILPNEDVDIYKFVDSIDSEKYTEIFDSEYSGSINTLIPKMKFDYDVDLNEILSNMGLDLSFDQSKADFTKLGDAQGNIYISKAKQKTALELDENGTKASAITIIDMTNKAMPMFDMVHLNRPFVMYIVDNATNLPIFSGVITNL